MCPQLFQIGPVTVNSYGFMILLGFIVCGLLLKKELKRAGYKADFAGSIILTILLGGYLGSKIYFLLERPFILDSNLWEQLLLPRGQVYYGALIGGFLATSSLVLIKRYPYLKIADVIAPFLLLGHAFGRGGCFLSGDGCYGPPSDLPWAMHFSNGVVSTINNPKLQIFYAQFHPNQPVPVDIAVHPTPLYDIVLLSCLFFILWSIRKKNFKSGVIFSLFFIFEGSERFITEFWRMNETSYFNTLSEAQILSLGLMFIGSIMLFLINKWYVYFKIKL